MFNNLKNIDTAFKHIRLFTFVMILACMVICCFTVIKSYEMVSDIQNRIYLLANGKALEALASGKKENIPVEARDHIKMFHHYFFTLDPDDKVINENLGKAFYYAGSSAKKQYDDLKESGYYSAMISGNISQRISCDSIQLNLDSYPYYFKYFGTEKIIRPTAILKRSLVTEGFLRNVSRSDNDPHGFLIERWRVLENRDISEEAKKATGSY